MPTNPHSVSNFAIPEFFNEQKPQLPEPNPSGELRPVKLRTEHLEQPMGLDAARPRLSWELECGGYDISVQASRIEVQNDGQTVWDSGWLQGIDHEVEYDGQEIVAHSRYRWRVCLRDSAGQESPWSDWQEWSTGFLGGEWQGRWIDPEQDFDRKKMQPCPELRRSFQSKQAPVRATIYLASRGFFIARLNGVPIGNEWFAPGWSAYHKRIQYRCHDVTELVTSGNNLLTVTLGDGWYRGSNGAYGHRNQFGDRLALLTELHLEYADGSRQLITSDEQWQAHCEGPIRYSDPKRGEHYDARRAGHAKKSNDNTDGWRNIRVLPENPSGLVSSICPPPIAHEEFTPNILQTPDGSTVLDFGQNIAGVVRFQVSGPAGHTVRLPHGETLDKHGNFTQANVIMDRPGPTGFQCVQYTLNGDGKESYQPHFTVHGFRYVQLQDWPEPVQPENFRAIALYSDLEQNGWFESSRADINRFVLNANWSQKGNFLDQPTDCPQRERCGWAGDAQVYYQTSSLFMDVQPFFDKWLADLALYQDARGSIASVIPPYFPDSRMSKYMMYGSAGWGDAAVIIPWRQYRRYGDRKLLQRCWPMMKAWVDFQTQQASSSHWLRAFAKFGANRKHQPYLWDRGYHWGEWLEPGRSMHLQIFKRTLISEPEVATAYFCYSATLLGKAARVLEMEEEATRYTALAEKIRAAYVACFTDKGRISGKWQARYVRPLALGLLDPDAAKQTAADLAAIVQANDFRINTGFLSTPFLLDVLTEHGYHDVAWKMLTQPECPGWMYQISRGATSIWERWDACDEKGNPRLSMNHYAYGSAVGWLYSRVAGLRQQDDDAGWKNLCIEPLPVPNMKRASARMSTPRGIIASSWECSANESVYSILIPPASNVQLTLPVAAGYTPDRNGVSGEKLTDGRWRFHLGSGNYSFKSQ